MNNSLGTKKFTAVILLLILFAFPLYGQNTLTVVVKDSLTKESLAGANVFFPALQIGAATDAEGKTKITNIPDGKYKLTISYIGYRKEVINLSFPLKKNSSVLKILLSPEEIKSKQVVVTSTRTNGVIESVPVKVEVLGQEEVNEEVAIRPTDVSKLLSETSGVFVRQTNVVSGGVRFRLEGLPGGYTQVLEDGLPVLNQLSADLTLLQIPPLDLKQVEVVKGASSLFYGNGAIAGFINLVTKKPAKKPELDFVFNQTSLKRTDLSAYYSKKFNRFGISLLAAQSFQQPVDVNGNGFTDLPEIRQTTLKPRFFWTFDNSTLEIGLKTFFGYRLGGDIHLISYGADSLHAFSEKNNSSLFSGEVKYTRNFGKESRLVFHNNITSFNRVANIGSWFFSGSQLYSFNEIYYSTKYSAHNLIAGVNFTYNKFKENDKVPAINHYHFNQTTLGMFFQDDWQITPKFLVEPGLRLDHADNKEFTALPHFSTLLKLNSDFSLRLTLGTGYKIPNVLNYAGFNSIAKHYVEIFPDRIKTEKSYSLNADFNYKKIIGEFVVKINQAFFYTQIKNALSLQYDYRMCAICGGIYYVSNQTLFSKGFDTNIYLGLDELEFFADYTFTDVRKKEYSVSPLLEFTPKNKINLTLTYEEEGNWRAGAEAFYIGQQYLPSDEYSRSYWLLGAMFQKYFNGFSVIFNVENILNERQTKYDKVVLPSPTIATPEFKQIYMPLEGIVANVSLWVRL